RYSAVSRGGHSHSSVGRRPSRFARWAAGRSLHFPLSAAASDLSARRTGSVLSCAIGFVTAALGGELEVPTLGGGRAKITIPDGTQTGHQFKLRGKGMPLLKAHGHHGDLFIEVRVETPVKLSKRQKELLRT